METNLGINPQRKFKVPHVYIILFAFIVITAIGTYIIPAGQYDRVPGPEGRMMVDPTSYQRIDQSPVSVLQVFMAVPNGFVQAALVIVLTFCVGGPFMVLQKTGAIQVGMNALTRVLAKKSFIIIPVLMAIFAIVDAFIGMPELCMVYIPILIPVFLALGYDSMTAAMVALAGSAAGFTAALTNPFTVALAQKIAGLPLYSGLQFRVIALIVTLIVGIIFVMRYANMVKKNPEKSPMFELDQKIKKTLVGNDTELKATTKQKLAGFSALILFIVLIVGVLQFQWDMPEIGAIFLAMGILSGLLGGLSGQGIVDAMNEGFEKVLIGALIIGVARGVTVVMQQGQITDTIIFGLSAVVRSLPGSITAVGMLFVQSVLNFFVPSGSGQTVLTMPIMAPLADVVGITRQTAVLALQYGDGLSNIIFPTSGYFMASLAIGGIPWEKWAKVVWPLILIWTGVGAVFLIIAQAIQWGPF